MRRSVLLLVLLVGWGALAPPAALAAAFDPEAATEAYLARVPPAQKARSDAYFEGGYWIQLWSFLIGLALAWLLLGTGLSARLRDLGERITRFRPLRVWIYAVLYTLVTSALLFPWTAYVDFFREHQYGMATHDFGGWFGDQVKGLLVALVFMPLLLAALYAVLRRAPRTWWLWGSVVAVAFLIVGVLIAPIWIAPLFNKYTPLEPGPIRESILSLAQANGVPADEVYMMDASRQTKRISANVSGLAGTTRVTLNDNLLERTSPPEIEAVMGHELGHYVLNHVYEMIVELGLVILIGFAWLYFASGRVLARFGERWRLRGVDDPAGLPLLAALLAVFFFVLTPINNTIIRVNEAEADIFGLNASRQPDGFAEVALKLGEYRKLSPGPIEEWVFYDHPSGRNRILMAMRWKAEEIERQAVTPNEGSAEVRRTP
ncbi:MAG TPA: M48 family metallopeptidase [Thermoanaerobaculia bacterium]